jgi:NADH:ubiquinone oxidoreductase subunit 5 (subunit L)/multisubunit Na+/H+ antiporter MnhA subunit
MPLFFSFSGILIASLLNILALNSLTNFCYNKYFLFFLFLANKKLYMDKIYNAIFVKPLLNFGYKVSFKNIDRGFIELCGPYGLSSLAQLFSRRVVIIQTGHLNHYIFFIIIGLSAFCFLVLYSWSFNFKVSSYTLGIFCILFAFM